MVKPEWVRWSRLATEPPTPPSPCYAHQNSSFLIVLSASHIRDMTIAPDRTSRDQPAACKGKLALLLAHAWLLVRDTRHEPSVPPPPLHPLDGSSPSARQQVPATSPSCQSITHSDACRHGERHTRPRPPSQREGPHQGIEAYITRLRPPAQGAASLFKARHRRQRWL